MQKPNKQDFFTAPLKRAKSLGSAKDGVGHWWWQRVTSVALIPLGIWFVVSLLNLVYVGGTAEATAAWAQVPANALLMALFLVALFWHTAQGLQVIIEDYVHDMGWKVGLVMLIKLGCFAAAVATIFALVKMHFMGYAPAAY